MSRTPTFTVVVDRSGLSVSDLTIAGNGSTSLTVVSYQEPALLADVGYGPRSAWIHGSQALSWSWQQTMLNFEVAARGVANEDTSRSLLAELVVAITQFSYDVTVTVDGASAETWACDPGSVTPSSDRDYPDLRHNDPVWAVSIPCYPVREVAS